MLAVADQDGTNSSNLSLMAYSQRRIFSKWNSKTGISPLFYVAHSKITEEIHGLLSLLFNYQAPIVLVNRLQVGFRVEVRSRFGEVMKPRLPVIAFALFQLGIVGARGNAQKTPSNVSSPSSVE